MERLLYLEDCAASDPFCFKEQTIHFNNGMRPCALCDCSKGLPEPDMEKPEKSWTHELLGDKDRQNVSTRGDSEISKSLLTDKDDRANSS